MLTSNSRNKTTSQVLPMFSCFILGIAIGLLLLPIVATDYESTATINHTYILAPIQDDPPLVEEVVPEPVPDKKPEPKKEIPKEDVKQEPKKKVKESKTDDISNAKEFEITAYDNSVQSQGKWVDQTATGFNLKGHSRESARCIAVDPKVIPLGSEVQITFDDKYKKYNGRYIARDTGGAIKGNRIDLFMGDGPTRQQALDFGRRKAKVKIIK